MNKKITIAIDAMGGENAPEKTINGVKYFLDRNKSKNDFLLLLHKINDEDLDSTYYTFL